MDHPSSDDLRTVAILYPGELGSALATLLVRRGTRVVTTLAGRGPRTGRLASQAGCEVLESIGEVKRVAGVVMSLVPPSAACEVARQFCDAQPRETACVYVDANSVSPQTARHIALLLDESGVAFVDATIHGLASRLEQQGTLYLSGTNAARVAELTYPVLRTRILGDEPGAASAMKMMLGGLSKALVALFLEMSVMARQAGALDAVLAEYERYYPGVMTAIERLVPTYPRHAARRGDELRQVSQTMRSMGLEPTVVEAAERLIRQMGRFDLAGRDDPESAPLQAVHEVIEQVFLHGLLRAREATASAAQG